MMMTDSIWSLQEIIIYDASREKVLPCQRFHLKQILNHESVKFVLFYGLISRFLISQSDAI